MTCGLLASRKFKPRIWFIYSYENIEKFIKVNGMEYCYV